MSSMPWPIRGSGTTEVDLALGPFRAAPLTEQPTRARGYWTQSWERLRANRFGIFFGAMLLLLTVIAIAAPLISQLVTHYDPATQDLDVVFAPPSAKHWLGADELGRDTFTRLVWGARVSLGVGFLTVALYIVIGGSVGLASGFFRGWVDETLMRFVDMLLAIPTIFLLILITSLLPLRVGPPGQVWFTIQHDALSLTVIIAATVWGRVARLVRGETLAISSREFITAAHGVGASDRRIILRHIVPNVLPVTIVTASLGVGQIILTEAALDFIGLGVQPPVASWGNMLLNSQSYLFHSIWLVLWPGLAILLAVLSANIFGNAVRDAFDPRLTS
jgi:peptide/nickel transport system permease protein